MAHLSLFEFNQLIKDSLDQHIPKALWIVAEIGEMRLNQKGHCYMELVEKEGSFIQAKLKANIWAYQYRSISSQFLHATGSPLAPGIKVLLQASINFHEIYGLSVTVSAIDPNYTLGERSKQREETIKKLQQSGALDRNKALNLPYAPQRIAVISSQTAAGYQDFIEQLKSNSRGLDIQTTLFNAMMQGNEAPQSIMAAGKQALEQGAYDLMVVIRGGGAQTDLDCFDDYTLNEWISHANIPLITGIGHERDQTIIDLVAHTALKTPTAVAEFILDGLVHIDDVLHDAFNRLTRAAETTITEQNNRLDYFVQQLQNQSNYLISSSGQMLERYSKLLSAGSTHNIQLAQTQLANLAHIINLNDPKVILNKGYTITLKNGKSIQQQSLNSGDELVTLTAQKKIKSQVTQIEND